MGRGWTEWMTAAALVVATAVPAGAGSLQLEDGRFVDGVKMRREGDKILLLYENGPIEIPLERVKSYVVDEGEAWEPKTDEERAKAAQGLVPFRDEWVTVEERDKELERERKERQEALEEHKQHQEWRNRYQFETKNFAFQSTLPPDINEQYADLLETYFEEFGKYWRVRVPKDWDRKLTVCFHRDRESFHKIGGVSGGVLAYYRFVPPRELHFYFNRKFPAETQSAMFHEANHYLADLMDEKFQYPHWIGEAMAEYYAASTWDPEKGEMTIGNIQTGRLLEVLKDMDGGDVMTVEGLVSDETRNYAHYYWGWSFVHFLLESKDHKKNFIKYFEDLANGRGIDRKRQPPHFTTVGGEQCWEHFQKRMKLKDEEDVEELQNAWYEHIKGMAVDSTLGLEIAGITAYRQGRGKFRGRRLLEEAIDKGSTNVEAYLVYANCLALAGEFDAVGEIYAKACELDPIHPNAWFERGMYLRGRPSTKEEGERMVRLAQELDPDNIMLDVVIELSKDTEEDE